MQNQWKLNALVSTECLSYDYFITIFMDLILIKFYCDLSEEMFKFVVWPALISWQENAIWSTWTDGI